MRRLGLFVLLLVVVGAAAGATWWLNQSDKSTTELKLFGNVDLRQIQLSFQNNERITDVLVQEGDRVKKGQVLARVDTRRIEPQVAQSEATLNAQRAVVERLHHGNRPEEIAQAKANMEAAKADAGNARRNYARMKDLSDRSRGEAISRQDVDNAKSASETAVARLDAMQKSLEVWILGPRKEEVAENEARLKADEAQLAYLRQQLNDAQLRAPADSVVRTRLMEPGDMASPTKPVFSLAVIDPKWVRAYVSEINLGKVREGMKVSIDSRQLSESKIRGMDRLHLTNCRVHPQVGANRRAADESRLRSPCLHQGPQRRVAAGHAGHRLYPARRRKPVAAKGDSCRHRRANRPSQAPNKAA